MELVCLVMICLWMCPMRLFSVGGYLAGDVHAHPALGACSRVNRSQSVDHPQSAMPTALASGGKKEVLR